MGGGRLVGGFLELPSRMKKCKKCKKEVLIFNECDDCKLALCIPCDNSSSLLNWFEVSPELEVKDVYICSKCEKKRLKKEDGGQSSLSGQSIPHSGESTSALPSLLQG